MNPTVLDAAEAALEAEANARGARFVRGHAKAPVPADPGLMAAIARACASLDLAHVTLPSGAGHDAMNLAEICPYAMIFVPSQDGLSHAPEEFTTAAACIAGVRVLLATLLELDTK